MGIIEILMVLFAAAAFSTGPVMWENLPTCHLEDPAVKPPVKCREVRGQWGGTVDGRIHPGEK